MDNRSWRDARRSPPAPYPAKETDLQSAAPVQESSRTATFAGIACGTGAAVFWAVGFVAARHAIALGFWPSELVLHRFIWAGIVFLPVIARLGWVNFGGVGWGRSALLTVTGGPPLAHLSYAGFLFVPLAHGGVIQPSCAAIGGLLVARIVLKERLSVQRAAGAFSIVAGLCVIGSEALASIGGHGILGDLAFASAGSLFASFATMLRLWRVAPMRVAAVTSVMALLEAPVHWLLFGFDHLIELGLFENLVQALAQGVFAGPAAIYLFTRSVVLLGAGRAAVFPSLVPGFTLLIGWLVLGELPTLIQLLGFGIVLIGFQLTQRA